MIVRERRREPGTGRGLDERRREELMRLPLAVRWYIVYRRTMARIRAEAELHGEEFAPFPVADPGTNGGE